MKKKLKYSGASQEFRASYRMSRELKLSFVPPSAGKRQCGQKAEADPAVRA